MTEPEGTLAQKAAERIVKVVEGAIRGTSFINDLKDTMVAVLVDADLKGTMAAVLVDVIAELRDRVDAHECGEAELSRNKAQAERSAMQNELDGLRQRLTQRGAIVSEGVALVVREARRWAEHPSSEMAQVDLRRAVMELHIRQSTGEPAKVPLDESVFAERDALRARLTEIVGALRIENDEQGAILKALADLQAIDVAQIDAGIDRGRLADLNRINALTTALLNREPERFQRMGDVAIVDAVIADRDQLRGRLTLESGCWLTGQAALDSLKVQTAEVRAPVRIEITDAPCASCGEKQPQGGVAVSLGAVTIVLCQECGNRVGDSIHNKLWQLGRDVPTCDELTSDQVASFSTYPRDLLLDELVMSTVRWHIGPLDGDERRIAAALLERLATLGIARKVHREGCKIWPKYRLCSCPWAMGLARI